jgi:membrane protease YdiL (CAAX protease family)
MAIPVALSIRLPELIPRIFTASDKSPILLMGLTAGFAAGCFEELGWTGFVVPKLRLRCGTFSTGVVVGLLWGAWHIPVNLVASVTPSGAISVPGLLASLLFSFGLLTAYRVLMVSVFDHTGSLLIAMLMHMSLTASNIILGATATPGIMAITFNLALTAAMWVVVALLFSLNAGRLSIPVMGRILRRRVS